MEYLHTRGVKGYLVLNVLIFDDELEILAEKAQHAARSGVDAVIVQDIGAVEIIQKAAPGLAIHGSTQMTITSAEGAAFAGSRGIERIVVGRELSIKDIASVATGSNLTGSDLSTPPPPPPPEVEAFVHGALCVSYSGQCFSSEAWGGRSANRGQCAQACRLDYGLLVDGELKYLGDVQYLLSPQDLSAVELVPHLMLAGVTSFKIEGRLKGPEYVAMTTRVYREAVNAAWNEYICSTSSNTAANSTLPKYKLDNISKLELQQVFARGQDSQFSGLTSGFLEGPQHQMLVRGRAPRHRGVFLGHVERVNDHSGGAGRQGSSGSSWSVVVELAAPVRRGDGVVFDQGNPQAEEFGGAIYDIKVLSSQQKRNGRKREGAQQRNNGGSNSGSRSVLDAEEGSLVDLVLGSGPNLSSFFSGIKPGDLIWKNKDPILESKLKTSYENISAAERRRVSVTVHVTASLGRPLKITLVDEKGRNSEAETTSPIEIATGRPLAAVDVEKAVGVHLGDEGSLLAASFDFSNGCEFEKGLFVSPGAIKDARRRAVAGLLKQQRVAPAMVAAAAAAVEAETTQEAPVVLKQVDDVLVDMRQSIATESRQWKQENNTKDAATMLRVLCRTKAQVDAAIQVPWLTEIVLDFLEVHGLKQACEAVRQSGKRVVVV
jgi:U32 family peptidase